MAEEQTKSYPGNMAQESSLYSVGEVCSMVGTTRKTLFYYDRIDLLEPTERHGDQKSKLYDISKVRRLKQILQYREAGLSISEIRELLDDAEADHLQILQKALERLQFQQQEMTEQLMKLQVLIRTEELNRQKG